jgi:hypothetical protein
MATLGVVIELEWKRMGLVQHRMQQRTSVKAVKLEFVREHFALFEIDLFEEGGRKGL